MSRYLLQDMMTVREHREDKAGKAAAAARRRFAEAEALVATRKTELDDYNAWRITEEERLIQSIMRRPVKLGDITDLRLEIAGLRERELDFIDRLEKARGERDRAREELDEAVRAHRKAIQDLEKLREHRTEWQREMKREEERLADLEIEDHPGPRTSATLDLALTIDESTHGSN